MKDFANNVLWSRPRTLYLSSLCSESYKPFTRTEMSVICGPGMHMLLLEAADFFFLQIKFCVTASSRSALVGDNRSWPALHVFLIFFLCTYKIYCTCFSLYCVSPGNQLWWAVSGFFGFFEVVLFPVHGRLARWRKWKSCDVGEAKEELENDLWHRWSDWKQSSLSKLSVASPTSQLILQPVPRFHYVTAHSPTLPFLHLHHSSFSNSSFASPTSQDFHLRHLASPPCSRGGFIL